MQALSSKKPTAVGALEVGVSRAKFIHRPPLRSSGRRAVRTGCGLAAVLLGTTIGVGCKRADAPRNAQAPALEMAQDRSGTPKERAKADAAIQILVPPMEVGEWREFTNGAGVVIKGRILDLSNDAVRLERDDGRTFTVPPHLYSAADQAYFRQCRIDHLVKHSILPAYVRRDMADREVLEFTLKIKRDVVQGWSRHDKEYRISHPTCTVNLPLDHKPETIHQLNRDIQELEEVVKLTL